MLLEGSCRLSRGSLGGLEGAWEEDGGGIDAWSPFERKMLLRGPPWAPLLGAALGYQIGFNIEISQ